jgi:histidine triad (HIT) family protein
LFEIISGDNNMTNCIFCKIAAKEMKSTVVYEDDELFAFRDINPQAPVHILLIPKKHILTINDLDNVDQALIGKMFLAAKEIAKNEGIDQSGYRTLFNCNRDAGQEVYHIHLHIIGGRKMTWPPG